MGIDPHSWAAHSHLEGIYKCCFRWTVMSYALWREGFQSGSQARWAETIDPDRRAYTVIGVMPQELEFHLVQAAGAITVFWVPLES